MNGQRKDEKSSGSTNAAHLKLGPERSVTFGKDGSVGKQPNQGSPLQGAHQLTFSEKMTAPPQQTIPKPHQKSQDERSEHLKVQTVNLEQTQQIDQQMIKAALVSHQTPFFSKPEKQNYKRGDLQSPTSPQGVELQSGSKLMHELMAISNHVNDINQQQLNTEVLEEYQMTPKLKESSQLPSWNTTEKKNPPPAGTLSPKQVRRQRAKKATTLSTLPKSKTTPILQQQNKISSEEKVIDNAFRSSRTIKFATKKGKQDSLRTNLTPNYMTLGAKQPKGSVYLTSMKAINFERHIDRKSSEVIPGFERMHPSTTTAKMSRPKPQTMSFDPAKVYGKQNSFTSQVGQIPSGLTKTISKRSIIGSQGADRNSQEQFFNESSRETGINQISSSLKGSISKQSFGGNCAPTKTPPFKSKKMVNFAAQQQLPQYGTNQKPSVPKNAILAASQTKSVVQPLMTTAQFKRNHRHLVDKNGHRVASEQKQNNFRMQSQTSQNHENEINVSVKIQQQPIAPQPQQANSLNTKTLGKFKSGSLRNIQSSQLQKRQHKQIKASFKSHANSSQGFHSEEMMTLKQSQGKNGSTMQFSFKINNNQNQQEETEVQLRLTQSGTKWAQGISQGQDQPQQQQIPELYDPAEGFVQPGMPAAMFQSQQNNPTLFMSYRTDQDPPSEFQQPTVMSPNAQYWPPYEQALSDQRDNAYQAQVEHHYRTHQQVELDPNLHYLMRKNIKTASRANAANSNQHQLLSPNAHQNSQACMSDRFFTSINNPRTMDDMSPDNRQKQLQYYQQPKSSNLTHFRPYEGRAVGQELAVSLNQQLTNADGIYNRKPSGAQSQVPYRPNQQHRILTAQSAQVLARNSREQLNIHGNANAHPTSSGGDFRDAQQVSSSSVPRRKYRPVLPKRTQYYPQSVKNHKSPERESKTEQRASKQPTQFSQDIAAIASDEREQVRSPQMRTDFQDSASPEQFFTFKKQVEGSNSQSQQLGKPEEIKFQKVIQDVLLRGLSEEAKGHMDQRSQNQQDFNVANEAIDSGNKLIQSAAGINSIQNSTFSDQNVTATFLASGIKSPMMVTDEKYSAVKKSPNMPMKRGQSEQENIILTVAKINRAESRQVAPYDDFPSSSCSQFTSQRESRMSMQPEGALNIFGQESQTNKDEPKGQQIRRLFPSDHKNSVPVAVKAGTERRLLKNGLGKYKTSTQAVLRDNRNRVQSLDNSHVDKERLYTDGNKSQSLQYQLQIINSKNGNQNRAADLGNQPNEQLMSPRLASANQYGSGHVKNDLTKVNQNIALPFQDPVGRNHLLSVQHTNQSRKVTNVMSLDSVSQASSNRMRVAPAKVIYNKFFKDKGFLPPVMATGNIGSGSQAPNQVPSRSQSVNSQASGPDNINRTLESLRQRARSPESQQFIQSSKAGSERQLLYISKPKTGQVIKNMNRIRNPEMEVSEDSASDARTLSHHSRPRVESNQDQMTHTGEPNNDPNLINLEDHSLEQSSPEVGQQQSQFVQALNMALSQAPIQQRGYPHQGQMMNQDHQQYGSQPFVNKQQQAAPHLSIIPNSMRNSQFSASSQGPYTVKNQKSGKFMSMKGKGKGPIPVYTGKEKPDEVMKQLQNIHKRAAHIKTQSQVVNQAEILMPNKPQVGIPPQQIFSQFSTQQSCDSPIFEEDTVEDHGTTEELNIYEDKSQVDGEFSPTRLDKTDKATFLDQMERNYTQRAVIDMGSEEHKMEGPSRASLDKIVQEDRQKYRLKSSKLTKTNTNGTMSPPPKANAYNRVLKVAQPAQLSVEKQDSRQSISRHSNYLQKIITEQPVLKKPKMRQQYSQPLMLKPNLSQEKSITKESIHTSTEQPSDGKPPRGTYRNVNQIYKRVAVTQVGKGPKTTLTGIQQKSGSATSGDSRKILKKSTIKLLSNVGDKKDQKKVNVKEDSARDDDQKQEQLLKIKRIETASEQNMTFGVITNQSQQLQKERVNTIDSIESKVGSLSANKRQSVLIQATNSALKKSFKETEQSQSIQENDQASEKPVEFDEAHLDLVRMTSPSFAEKDRNNFIQVQINDQRE